MGRSLLASDGRAGQRRPCQPKAGWDPACATASAVVPVSQSCMRVSLILGFAREKTRVIQNKWRGTGYASCGNAPADPAGAAGNQARCTASPAQAAPSKCRKARPTPIFIASARLAPTNDGHVPRAHQTKAQLGCLAAACTCGGAEPSRARARAWHPLLCTDLGNHRSQFSFWAMQK